VGRQMIAGSAFGAAWQQLRCTQHLFGSMPGRHAEPADSTRVAEVRETRS
jgi:xanthosine utilization system XapX-like protein